jgi:hypothetical protein
MNKESFKNKFKGATRGFGFGDPMYANPDGSTKRDFVSRLFQTLWESPDAKARMSDIAEELARQGIPPEHYAEFAKAAYDDPLSFKKYNNPNNVFNGAPPIGETASELMGAIGRHPLRALGTTIGVGSNIAGIFDNKKFLGQGVGLGLGAAAGYILPKFTGLGPYGALNLTLAGGALGSLFDKLRAKREQEKEQAAQSLPANETTY